MVIWNTFSFLGYQTQIEQCISVSLFSKRRQFTDGGCAITTKVSSDALTPSGSSAFALVPTLSSSTARVRHMVAVRLFIGKCGPDWGGDREAENGCACLLTPFVFFTDTFMVRVFSKE